MNSTTPPTHAFGPLLRGLRLRAGFSQEELAHASGVSVRALADMERGRTRGPQRRTIEALAHGLALTADEARDLAGAAAPGRAGAQATTAQATTAQGPAPAAGPAGLPVPLSLPRDPRDFTARGQALADVLALAERPDAAYPPVIVVTGQPGLGKTAFGIRSAHALAPRFPDGQLFFDLRGMDEEPTHPRDALATLLRALDVAEHAIPHDLQDRSGLLRSLLAGRRLLLVLDNAADEDQVRPLLPGSGGTLTLVTSRRGLIGLEAVHRIDLPLLRREESVELLARIIGPERVGREAQAARDLADLCGHLPLAIRIVGGRLASRPQERLRKLATQLAGEESRLDLLRAGDLQVRAAFALSYRRLAPATQTLLRRSALAAGPDFSAETAALLAGTTVRAAELGLEELTDRGLLQTEAAVERYRFHDLLRLFAGELVADEDGAAVEEAARERAGRWMLARATTAGLHFDAQQHQPAGGDPDPATAPSGRDRARAWLEAEAAQWLAALRHAHHTGRHREVVDAAEAMHWFSDLTQHWDLWVEVFERAADAARSLSSPREEATHLNYLAWAYNLCVHDHHSAAAAARAAYAAARTSGDRLQMGWALGYEAGALRRLGRAEEAVAKFREAADCHHENTTPQGRLAELTTLNALGEVLRDQGHADQALAIHRRSDAICRAGIPGSSPELLALYQASALQHIGSDHAALGQWQQAEEPLRKALAAFEGSAMPAWSGPVHLELGRVLRHTGDLPAARAALNAALKTLTEHKSPRQAEARAELQLLDALFSD
ncbi:helix-turn-helix domain-containing protein [Streptomyces sp. HSW2009]|uniref:ATP-binding protein n=1 Tax=Streptomyces sp. HSW2009 TaxID=3142890 RepID=UPI0032ED1D11